MSSFAKILGGTALGAGLIAGVNYFRQLHKAKVELEILPKANLYSLNWDGITVRVDVLLKNPTGGSFYIKFPYVKLIYKTTIVGSSHALNKDIKIPAYGEALIEKILITIPVTSVFSVVFALVKALHNKEPVKMTVKTMTTVDIGIAKLPYESETEVIIKR